MSASAAICAGPRIASSTMPISVSVSSLHSVSGTPSSLLKLASAATVRARGAQIAARMSFVDVLPVEPVIATTRAVLRSRTARPSAASAENASSGTSVAAAPPAKAARAYASPGPTATNRSSRADAPRIDLHAGHERAPEAACKPARTTCFDLVELERDHARVARRLSASRATSRSSKERTRPATSWPCS